VAKPAATNRKVGANPADLRAMFGANLKFLCREAPSISALCRDLGINRTQFNRYLSGESFPRPDVLHRICSFFDVDARILLQPVEEIATASGFAMHHPQLAGFLGPEITDIPQELLPDGFFRFIRRSFMDQQKFVEALVYVYRVGDFCFIRGHEAREAMTRVGLPESPRQREFGGFFFRQERGVAAIVARRGATTGSFTFLHRVPSMKNNTWTGYTARITHESENSHRMTRIVWEHLGRDIGSALDVARNAGFRSYNQLSESDQELLRPDKPFA
jgi:transcriptional regulator with XRE-family HTH domain